MMRIFIGTLAVIMITMAIVGAIYVAMVGGTPADILPILLGAAVVGVPMSAWNAWKNRNR